VTNTQWLVDFGVVGAGGVNELVKEILMLSQKKKNAGFVDRKPEVKNFG